MSENTERKPAFPCEDSGMYYYGMTLRDYFAAKAMASLCRNGDDHEATANFAYKYADAMMKERSK